MAKLITFNAPAIDKGKPVTVEKRGYVCKLYVGNVQEKFVLQVSDIVDGQIECLTHFASGNKVGDLAPIRLQNIRSYARMTDREAAEKLIHGLVVKYGANKVRATINAAPVINA